MVIKIQPEKILLDYIDQYPVMESYKLHNMGYLRKVSEQDHSRAKMTVTCQIAKAKHKFHI
jgi:hypothetical protein